VQPLLSGPRPDCDSAHSGCDTQFHALKQLLRLKAPPSFVEHSLKQLALSMAAADAVESGSQSAQDISHV
jgi:hypothetical protein